jgi:hypothetical protein
VRSPRRCASADARCALHACARRQAAEAIDVGLNHKCLQEDREKGGERG